MESRIVGGLSACERIHRDALLIDPEAKAIGCVDPGKSVIERLDGSIALKVASLASGVHVMPAPRVFRPRVPFVEDVKIFEGVRVKQGAVLPNVTAKSIDMGSRHGYAVTEVAHISVDLLVCLASTHIYVEKTFGRLDGAEVFLIISAPYESFRISRCSGVIDVHPAAFVFCGCQAAVKTPYHLISMGVCCISVRPDVEPASGVLGRSEPRRMKLTYTVESHSIGWLAIAIDMVAFV
jgi:hypothetical protein